MTLTLSIVTTLYHSSPYIEEFYRRASEAAREYAGDSYEIIMVNDGSPDDCLQKAIKFAEDDPHLMVVDLTRNFGHHRAMILGLRYSTGNLVFLIDSDLEEEPEWLLDFARQMDAEACDVVLGQQARRKGGWFERWSGEAYYSIYKKLTGFNYPRNAVTARLMKRRYVDAFLLHNEFDVDVSGLFYLTGFEQHTQQIVKHSTSPSTYSLSRKIFQAIAGITSTSFIPLTTIFYTGGLISLGALVYIVYLVLGYVFLGTGRTIDGWTSTIVSIWLLGGIIIFFMGVVGLYLSKIFTEVKQRPILVRKVYNNHEPQADDTKGEE